MLPKQNLTAISLTASQGQSAYESGEFAAAARLFGEAADQYSESGCSLEAAEMANNRSVALLQAGDARAALRVAEHTDEVFAAAGDVRRQGMALGNQAAALEKLGKHHEAEAAYTRSAELLGQAGARDLQASALTALSALQLRHRDTLGAMTSMQTALASKEHLTVRENILKRLIRSAVSLLTR